MNKKRKPLKHYPQEPIRTEQEEIIAQSNNCFDLLALGKIGIKIKTLHHLRSSA